MHYLSLNKKSSQPYYLQIEESIDGAIQSGILKHGDKLATVNEIAQFFEISIMAPDNPDYEKRVNEHVAFVTTIVEETIDLTDVEIINYYCAPGLPDYVYGGLSAILHEPMDTQRGEIYNYNVKKFEMLYIDDPIVFATNIYHGTAHNLGLSDIYVHHWVPEFVGKPPNYKYGNWDVMTSAINELNGWHRWILSWIDDDQFHCFPP